MYEAVDNYYHWSEPWKKKYKKNRNWSKSDTVRYIYLFMHALLWQSPRNAMRFFSQRGSVF